MTLTARQRILQTQLASLTSMASWMERLERGRRGCEIAEYKRKEMSLALVVCRLCKRGAETYLRTLLGLHLARNYALCQYKANSLRKLDTGPEGPELELLLDLKRANWLR